MARDPFKLPMALKGEMLTENNVNALLTAALEDRFARALPDVIWTPVFRAAWELADIKGFFDSIEFRMALIDIANAVTLPWSSALPAMINNLEATEYLTWNQVKALKTMWEIAVKEIRKPSLHDLISGFRWRR